MDREAVAKECAAIERRGGDVIEYLKGLGCVSPWGTWHRLQVEELKRKHCDITDGRGRANMSGRKLSEENKKEAVRLAIAGESPLPYLESCGVKNADVSWASIKRMLAKNDPETYAKLPKRNARRGNGIALPVKPQKAAAKTQQEKTAAQDPDEGKGHTEERKPLVYMGYTVKAIQDDTFGEFYYDRILNALEWETPDGTTVTFSPAEWTRFATEILPEVMGILGVDV